MYFDLPKTGRHAKNDDNQKRSDYASDERMSEIRDNVEDHWGSPPILTPETLAYILENQWVSDDNGSASDLKMKKSEVIQSLIAELYKTIEIIDSEKEHKITKELDNDFVLQQVRSSEKLLADEKTLEHLVNLLKACNQNQQL